MAAALSMAGVAAGFAASHRAVLRAAVAAFGGRVAAVFLFKMVSVHTE